MKEFREVIAKEFNVEPDSFRVYRKSALDSELSGDKAQTLYSLGFYNGIPLHLSPGKPLMPGHYLLKLFWYKPSGRSALHDLEAMELPATVDETDTSEEPLLLPEVDETPEIVEASATMVNSSHCVGVPAADGDVVMAEKVAPVPETSNDSTTLSVATGTPISLSDLDIDVLSNATPLKSAPQVGDPFKIDENTPESSSSDILGFGYKMVASPQFLSRSLRIFPD